MFSLRCSLSIVTLAFIPLVHAKMPLPLLEQAKASAPAFLKDKGAELLDVAPAPGGLTAYTAVKNGNTIIVYTTPDQSVSIVGALFDAKTGANLSDQFLARSDEIVSKSGHASTSVQSVASSTDTVLNGQKARLPIANYLFSEQVAGIKEGSGNAVGTTYVFIDPRCGYCHNLYHNTRKVAAQGASIKWIPVNTLGEKGIPISAAALRGGGTALDALANNKLRGQDPTSAEREQIRLNTQIFSDIANQVGKPMATPSIVFLSANGKFSVVQDDGSDKAAFSAAFRVSK